jgi:integrase
MTTTIKFNLRAPTCVSESSYLTLQVTRHRLTRNLSTGCKLSLAEWDEKRQVIKISEDTSAVRKKELSSFMHKLKKMKQTALFAEKALAAKGDFSAQDFVCRFRELQDGQLFCNYVFHKSNELDAASRFSTANTYYQSARSFLNFLKGDDVRIEKITPCLIKLYEHSMEMENKKKNTISCYMRTLRAAFNLSIVENKCGILKKANEKPFSGVFTGNDKTQKRAIGAKSISILAEMKIEEPEEKKQTLQSANLAHDTFMFSFYTQGMSFADVVNLKKENIKNNIIRYNRKKTGQEVVVEVEDCTKAIINRYDDPRSEYLFPVLRGTTNERERWQKTNSAMGVYNKNLKKLAKAAGIETHLTGYVARHSWASLASQEGIPMATISRGMGHESEKTTRIYISQLDYSDVGEANRKIIAKIHSA